MSPPAPIPPNSAATASLNTIPTPAYGTGGTFSVACSTSIAAAPLTCLSIVLDAPNYASWNRFCRSVIIDQQPAEPAQPPPPGVSSVGEHALRLGTKFTFDVHMNPDAADGSKGRPSEEEVSVLERIDEAVQAGDGSPTRQKGWRVAWKLRNTLFLPKLLLHCERVQEFIEAETPDGRLFTTYACWETFYGLLAPVLRLAVGGQLCKGFDAWMRDLKKRAEEMEQSAELPVV
ncbi:hypothetical protein B0T22DRAFT_402736 [Podospora appendiculata]|uniref:Coenzyme Q-binding protein COQ10 START domain-containing protein n=1 Tax=Podospora appendiculata TaxID=314037 RepID=A0AAE0XJU9_9PEZI|nr:hypothetical protein B0T22DRAFT_402736 [Podospora appendiculata]